MALAFSAVATPLRLGRSNSPSPSTCRTAPAVAFRGSFVSVCRAKRAKRRVIGCPLVLSAAGNDPASTSPTPSAPSVPVLPDDGRGEERVERIWQSLWQFCRPHTVYGTVLSIMSMTAVAYLRTAATSPLHRSAFVVPLLTALIPALFLNVYIVGLNQYYDVAIDKVNKPQLPLASGALSERDARVIILTSLVAGLSFCFLKFPLCTAPLAVALVGSAALGTLYSAPPFRLKRFALLASISILTVRGLLVNLCFFVHAVVASSAQLTASSWMIAGVPLPSVIVFATAFFTAFGIVIALLKDVPDIQGDRLFGIRTFSVRVGAAAVFRTCVTTLVAMFLCAALFYFFVATNGFTARCVSLVLHAGMALFLWWRSRKVDPSCRASVTDYYMLSWKAFYAEYLFLPFAAM